MEMYFEFEEAIKECTFNKLIDWIGTFEQSAVKKLNEGVLCVHFQVKIVFEMEMQRFFLFANRSVKKYLLKSSLNWGNSGLYLVYRGIKFSPNRNLINGIEESHYT